MNTSRVHGDIAQHHTASLCANANRHTQQRSPHHIAAMCDTLSFKRSHRRRRRCLNAVAALYMNRMMDVRVSVRPTPTARAAMHVNIQHITIVYDDDGDTSANTKLIIVQILY